MLMKPSWFKKRGYKHFDVPVCHVFADAIDSSIVTRHVWSPLIHYIKRIKRYKPGDAKTSYKPRPIMYASHRDACILSKYAACLTDALDKYYSSTVLSANVIGYRRLGKSNYHFSAEAYRFALKSSPCIVLCFDITGFFDHLDHKLLKDRLKRVLGVQELPHDWYKVFRHVTKFHYVNRDDLVAHPIFGQRMKSRRPTPLATIAEIKAASIAITANKHSYGIPQGTPISSVFSNLYMIDVDREISAFCDARGALYRRYSDDIIIICSKEHESAIQATLLGAVAAHKLEIKEEKTERCSFNASSDWQCFNIWDLTYPHWARPSGLVRWHANGGKRGATYVRP